MSYIYDFAIYMRFCRGLIVIIILYQLFQIRLLIENLPCKLRVGDNPFVLIVLQGAGADIQPFTHFLTREKVLTAKQRFVCLCHFLNSLAYSTDSGQRTPIEVQRCIYTTNWIERLNRKYKRTVSMRTSMPSDKSVIFLLAAVAMEETKKTYARRIYQFKNWKEKIRNEWKERIEGILTHFERQYRVACTHHHCAANRYAHSALRMPCGKSRQD